MGRRAAGAPLLVVLTAFLASCATEGGGGLDRDQGVTADPEMLIGLAPRQISEALGKPEFQRQEPPAEVWQYRTSACVFDLYLYEEDEGSRAAHYAARGRGNEIVDPASCLGSVVERWRLAGIQDAEEAPAPSS